MRLPMCELCNKKLSGVRINKTIIPHIIYVTNLTEFCSFLGYYNIKSTGGITCTK